MQTKLQSFSNWGDHNRKLESVCPRYKMPENHTWYAWFYTKCPLKLSNFKVVLNSTSTTGFLLIEWSQCAWLSTFIKATAFHYSYLLPRLPGTKFTCPKKEIQLFLNGTAVTDLVLIQCTQCTRTSTFTKSSALHHYSSFCYREYLTQSLLHKR